MRNSIETLYGTKQGKELVILAGGYSVNDFRYADFRNCEIMAINFNFLNVDIDYYIHVDKYLEQWYEMLRDLGYEFKLIAFDKTASDLTNYTFTADGYSHTTPYAVKIALDMGYDKIYLYGADYTGDPKHPHYYNREGEWLLMSDFELRRRYHTFKERVLDMAMDGKYDNILEEKYKKRMLAEGIFDITKDYNREHFETPRVINMSKISRLTKFKKG